MKTQKVLVVLATASLLGLSVGCNDRYAEGVTDGKAQGYEEGYNDGYADGDEAGFERAKAYFATADYNAGFNAGNTAGIATGYNQGYSVGKQDGKAEGYTTGYNVGHVDGLNEGTAIGYDMGYDDGSADGYDLGYDDGFGDGYDFGYSDGFDDGFALSVGKSKKLKGYANLLSMVHNDLFDYSKIKAPKQTARGLVVNGQMLLSETSLTNKDTLKRAAVVEQYLVVEMSKQVKGKFGLSAERSLKVAKAANHFRKFSTKRALTAEDTNAYAEEILGANFSAIEKAYSQSMKGDLSSLNTVLEKAADKNGVSPEKMGEIMTQLFI
ncbi:MAG TPA: Yae1 family protein [Bacteriovoracaceae bacterium]|nr:Yae1 family protein [Bacteriovoracaceae bacterium]